MKVGGKKSPTAILKKLTGIITAIIIIIIIVIIIIIIIMIRSIICKYKTATKKKKEF